MEQSDERPSFGPSKCEGLKVQPGETTDSRNGQLPEARITDWMIRRIQDNGKSKDKEKRLRKQAG